MLPGVIEQGLDVATQVTTFIEGVLRDVMTMAVTNFKPEISSTSLIAEDEFEHLTTHTDLMDPDVWHVALGDPDKSRFEITPRYINGYFILTIVRSPPP